MIYNTSNIISNFNDKAVYARQIGGSSLNEQILTAHGIICALGDLAYRNRETGDRWKMSVDPQIGNQVTYGKYAGQKIVVQNVRFILLNDDEITSIIPKGVEITAYI